MSDELRVDAYIDRAEDFAKPILKHLRGLVHQACPEAREVIKWGCPHFDYKGPLCHMAAFKKHCAMGFWKAALMKDKNLMETAKAETAMGHLGKITSLKDLPADKVLLAYIREAMAINEQGLKLPSTSKPATKEQAKALKVPTYLRQALRKLPAANEAFEAFSYANKKEYIEWLEEAKTDVTRSKRLETALEWISEGKTRNWKYKK